MEKSNLLFCQKLVNLQNLKNVTHIKIVIQFLREPTKRKKPILYSTTNLFVGFVYNSH